MNYLTIAILIYNLAVPSSKESLCFHSEFCLSKYDVEKLQDRLAELDYWVTKFFTNDITYVLTQSHAQDTYAWISDCDTITVVQTRSTCPAEYLVTVVQEKIE